MQGEARGQQGSKVSNSATGLFRGWLCLNCNLGLGNMQDNPLLMVSAIAYLTKCSQEEAERLRYLVDALVRDLPADTNGT